MATASAGVCLLLAALTVPVRADTATDLRQARARLAAIQTELNGLAVRYAAAESRLSETQARMDTVRGRIATIQVRVLRINGLLAVRAREAYESGGPSNMLELLLSSATFGQFADRVEFLGRVAQTDSDLLLQSAVSTEQLHRAQGELAALAGEQDAAVRTLTRTRDAIGRAFAAQQSEVQALQRKFDAERAAALAAEAARQSHPPSHQGGGGGPGPLKACPVGQPRSFTDDFGDPRPGGRRHQGIDILAPYGTPVYAAQSGRFEQNYNPLGGISALVFADNGDFTYYAHMSSYAGVRNGSHVPAGTEIGHVGNTGDAQGGPYHLHFEYHPGGGPAVDPYWMLVAVCG
jgi:murein DD-endopeptidase MepM/ murein hydrolase activator NlpD